MLNKEVLRKVWLLYLVDIDNVHGVHRSSMIYAMFKLVKSVVTIVDVIAPQKLLTLARSLGQVAHHRILNRFNLLEFEDTQFPFDGLFLVLHIWVLFSEVEGLELVGLF